MPSTSRASLTWPRERLHLTILRSYYHLIILPSYPSRIGHAHPHAPTRTRMPDAHVCTRTARAQVRASPHRQPAGGRDGHRTTRALLPTQVVAHPLSYSSFAPSPLLLATPHALLVLSTPHPPVQLRFSERTLYSLRPTMLHMTPHPSWCIQQ